MNTPANEWREVANEIGLATYGGVSFEANPEYIEKISKIINNLLTTHSAHLVERIEKLKVAEKDFFLRGDSKSTYEHAGRKFYNQALDQAIDIIKDKSDKQEV
jgi:uncharacterized protein (DUF2164 family)